MRRRRRKRCRRTRVPRPLPTARPLNLSDAAVKKLIRSAKKLGYVAHDQINSVLPSEKVNSEQIEGVLADETEVIEPDGSVRDIPQHYEQGYGVVRSHQRKLPPHAHQGVHYRLACIRSAPANDSAKSYLYSNTSVLNPTWRVKARQTIFFR
jgi:Sigma-70 factor, region 1.1